MIETPLIGRFQAEGRRLSFAAPPAYQALVRGTGIAGATMLALGLFGFDLVFGAGWLMWVGLMVLGAAVASALSLQGIVFDLREGTYRRRQGPGLFPRLTRGRLDELDALVLLAEPGTLGGTVTYHLVLHWKGEREPIMVLQTDTRVLPPGQPINGAAQQIRDLGSRYAEALRLRYFDNAYFASPCPVPLWK